MRVLLCDDHPGYRMMLSVFMGSDPELELVGEAASVAQLLDLAACTPFELALIDVEDAGDGGEGGAWSLDAIRALRTDHPDARIVAYAPLPSAELEASARDAGADGLVAKGINAVDTLRDVKAVARA